MSQLKYLGLITNTKKIDVNRGVIENITSEYKLKKYLKLKIFLKI